MNRRIRVLIADDNEDNRAALGDCLRLNGYDVIEADTAEAALEVARTELPDLIVLDLGFGDGNMDGYEVCVHLKGTLATRRIPIIILTCHGSVEDEVQGFQSGAQDYVIKPCRNEALLARIENLLDRYPPRKSRLHSHLKVLYETLADTAEFRVNVAVVSIDVAGSSQPKNTELKRVAHVLAMDAYHDLVEKALSDHGSLDAAWSGDGCIAEFETPRAAVDAAADILKAVALDNHANALRIRIGVAYGEELIERGIPIGKRVAETHNRAGHLQKYGTVGRIAVSAEVVQACAGAFAFVDREPVRDIKAFEIIV